MSSRTVLREAEKAEVIVSETLGALLLGEGTLDYLSDARSRLAAPGMRMIPAGGAQYAVLVSSATLASISSVTTNAATSTCHGFDLSAIGSLQDTATLLFTKQWVFRLNSLPDLVHMSERVQMFELDFGHHTRKDIPDTKVFRLTALEDGVIHAVVASWEIWSDEERTHVLTTHPEDTKDESWGFARDMQWGQGLQLLEDFDQSKSGKNRPPKSIEVKKGDPLLLKVNFSWCRQTFQFTLSREEGAFPPLGAGVARKGSWS